MSQPELKFLCSSCGACCRRVKNVKDFPEELIQEDGSCVNLQEDNTCVVYENRPDICNVDTHYEKVKDQYSSKREWFIMNNFYCNQFQEEDGMDESFRINIKDYDPGANK